jgi:hypothetical protein
VGIISSKSFIVCAIFSFVQNWKNLHYTCEPLLIVEDDRQLCWQEVWGSNWTKHYSKKVGMYFLLIREDNFTWWIKIALLPYTWRNNRRLESTLKEENRKYELTPKFIRWKDLLWLQMCNLCKAMFGPLPKMMFFSISI